MTTTLCIAALCLAATITDGDTLRAGGTGHRLWGIDAPERGDPAGPAATAALRALTKGRRLACDQVDTDRYQRPVVRCWLPDGRDLSCAMVAAGAARDWPKYSGGAYAGCGQ